MAKSKVIIDTDPGCDDVLALLLALASRPDDIEVVLISVTYGNISAKGCLQNVVSMFHVVQKEMQWRKTQGLPEGFDMLKKMKPTVAIGAKEPLGGQTMMADYYHGVDGLGGVHTSHPHHSSPAETWLHLFDPTPPQPPSDDILTATATSTTHTTPPSHSHLFNPSPTPSPSLILEILSTKPPDTITLIAIGPLTTFALAAALSPQTFIRAKALLVMGGAVTEPGNITPVGEFNCIADPIAAARIYALTGPDPRSTMPPPFTTPDSEQVLGAYPSKEELGSRRLNLILFPLDITTPHCISRPAVEAATAGPASQGSPLAEWVAAFLAATFRKTESLYHNPPGDISMAIHDAVPIWYALSPSSAPPFTSSPTSPQSDSEAKPGWTISPPDDVRVETTGQWTRGMCVVDRRGMRQLEEAKELGWPIEVSGDSGGWLSRWRGNRVRRCVGTPGGEALVELLLGSVFGG